MVLKFLTVSILSRYYVVFDDIFSDVAISTDTDPEVLIRLVAPRNLRIKVMLEQKDDLELDYEWLTVN